VPLHTLRENVQYGFAEARTLYGILGVKCWMCVEEDEKKPGATKVG
jgi:small subunit ribosomal protein S3